MYICICNGIREDELRRAAAATASGQHGGVEAIYARMGKRPQCRQCLDDAEDIVREEWQLAREPRLEAA